LAEENTPPTKEQIAEAFELNKQNTAQLQAQLQIQKDIADTAATAYERSQAELKVQQLKAEISDQQLQDNEKILQEEQLKLQAFDAQLASREVMSKLSKEEIADLRKQRDLIAGKAKASAAVLSSQKNTRDQREDGKAAAESTLDTMSGILGIERDINNTVVGRMAKVFSTQEGTESFLSGMAGGFKEMMNPLSVGLSLFQKFAEVSIALSLALDSMKAQFNLAASAGGEFNSQLNNIYNSSIGTFVGMESLGSAAKELKTNIGALAGQDAGELLSSNLAQNIGLLNELGLSVDVASATMNTFISAFEMTSQEAAQLTMDIAGLSMETGASIDEIGQDLGRLMPKLQAFGRDSVKIFANLERQAKATGASIDELANIGLRFAGSFNDSVTAAGQLNAMFGTSVDGMELFKRAATGDMNGALNMLRGQLQATGKDVTNMNFTELNSLANILGTDVDTIQKAFKGGIFPDGGDPNGVTQEQFQELLDKSQTLMSSLTELGKSFGVAFGPVMDMFNKLIQGVSWVINGTGTFGKVMMGMVLPLGLISMGVAKLAGSMKALASSTLQAAKSATQLNAADKSGGDIGGVKGGKGMGKLGKMGRGGLGGLLMGGLGLLSSFAAGETPEAKDWGVFLGTALGGALGALIPVPGGALLGSILGGMAADAVFHEGGGIGHKHGTGKDVNITAQSGEAMVPIQTTPAATNFAGLVADTVAANQAMSQQNINLKLDVGGNLEMNDTGKLTAGIRSVVNSALKPGSAGANGPKISFT
jgi:hypothetical protein